MLPSRQALRWAAAAPRAAFLILAACGSPPPSTSPGGILDGGVTAIDGGTLEAGGGGAADSRAGSDVGTAPSSHAPLPQIAYASGVGNSGGVLTAVKLVTITWKADTESLTAPLEAFGASIVTSAWWDAVRAGYCEPGSTRCVGDGTALTAHLGDLPMTPITDSAIGQAGGFPKFINDKTKAGDLPAPDASTLYVFYLPQGLTVTVDGVASCGYHGAASVTLPTMTTANVPYVVIPRCTVAGQMDVDAAIFAASREIVEAATDPYLAQGAAGFRLSDPAWAPAGDEVGDFCDPLGTGQNVAVQGAYAVARSWSNPSAAAGHDPCVPSSDAYYDVAPDPSTAQGITLAVGASTTFPAVAFSDAPVVSWQVQAQELGSTGALEVTLDRSTVGAGDVLNVTVKLVAMPASSLGGKSYERFALVSKGPDGTSHAWPVIVYAQ